MALDLSKAYIENLRGYSSCSIGFQRRRTVLVGKNNSGKTSILRLIDWLLNRADDPLVEGKRPPSDDLLEFLLPANTARHRARRLTLEIIVPDRRSHRRFQCQGGVAKLRINLRKTQQWFLYLALGPATRGESAESQPRALELLDRLREDIDFLYIPSFRDGASPRFRETLLNALQIRLSERALHSAQAGAPAEYRRVKRALGEICSIAEQLASPLWTDMRRYLPPGLAQNANFSLDIDPSGLIDWVSANLRFRLSTGDHDEGLVRVTDVGSGLQSLLDFAVHRSSAISPNKNCILVMEEPESFLHPSAQRTISRALLSDTNIQKTIITTHSPIVVEEAKYSDVVLCRNQSFYEPSAVSDDQREQINAALLTGYGAEMIFTQSVLLVEGEGDRLFFERLRRRLAPFDKSGAIDELFVVPVGSKTQFGPWIRLLESYTYRGDRPISWLVAADGDAASQVRQAFSDAQVQVPLRIIRAIGHVGAEMEHGAERWAQAVRALNTLTRRRRVTFMLLPVDLEDAMLHNLSNDTAALIAGKIGCQEPTREGLLAFLGSKASNNQNNSPVKAPWIRGLIAENIRWQEVSDDIFMILRRWFSGAMSLPRANRILRKARQEALELTN
jgi:hypothetical protein